MGNMYDEKILKKLEVYLAEYKKIFLISENGKVLNEIKEIFYHAGSEREEKVLLLTLQKININLNPSVVCEQITETEMEYIMKLYFMYEFSDRVQVVSKRSIYGELFSLKETGLFSPEEIREAVYIECFGVR